MGVKSTDLFVIINVAFFVTKSLNSMTIFYNAMEQLCFPFFLAFLEAEAPVEGTSGKFLGPLQTQRPRLCLRTR